MMNSCLEYPYKEEGVGEMFIEALQEPDLTAHNIYQLMDFSSKRPTKKL